MLSHKTARKTAEQLAQCALDEWGELKRRKLRPPLNQLILSTFAHLTSVRRATRGLRQLKRGFVDWNEIRITHPSEVAGALSSARWARLGAQRVVWVLRGLQETFHRMDLDFLAELNPAQARSCLTGLPAVPPYLADEVLLLSLDVPVLPCSPAAARMSWRLGLLANPQPTLENRLRLEGLFEKRYFVCTHLFLCDHAEQHCTVQAPACAECTLSEMCLNANNKSTDAS